MQEKEEIKNKEKELEMFKKNTEEFLLRRVNDLLDQYLLDQNLQRRKNFVIEIKFKCAIETNKIRREKQSLQDLKNEMNVQRTELVQLRQENDIHSLSSKSSKKKRKTVKK